MNGAPAGPLALAPRPRPDHRQYHRFMVPGFPLGGVLLNSVWLEANHFGSFTFMKNSKVPRLGFTAEFFLIVIVAPAGAAALPNLPAAKPSLPVISGDCPTDASAEPSIGIRSVVYSFSAGLWVFDIRWARVGETTASSRAAAIMAECLRISVIPEFLENSCMA